MNDHIDQPAENPPSHTDSPKPEAQKFLPFSGSSSLWLLGSLLSLVALQLVVATFIEPAETFKPVCLAIFGSLFGALLGYIIYILPQLPFGIIERTYCATLFRLATSLGVAVALLRQTDTTHYQLRIAIYILSAYGISLFVETVLITRSISSGNSKKPLKQSPISPDGS